jgi:PAS domain S-box-containing protein
VRSSPAERLIHTTISKRAFACYLLYRFPCITSKSPRMSQPVPPPEGLTHASRGRQAHPSAFGSDGTRQQPYMSESHLVHGPDHGAKGDERRRFEAILSSTEDFIYLFDLDGRFTYANRALLDLWGRDLESVVGMRFEDLGYPVELSALHAQQIDAVISSGKPLRAESAYAGPSGDARVYEYIFVPIFDASGRVEAVSGVTRDITHRKQAEAENERLLRESERERENALTARAEAESARRRADEANRSKAEFLAVMSHELRTPLNSISAYADLLAMEVHGPVNEAQRKSLDRIHSSQQHLLSIINGVLDYARIEAGNLNYEIADVDVGELLCMVEGVIDPQVQASGLRLNVAECPESLLVRGDPDKLRQILLNLLTNAVKFTPAGGSVEVLCHADDTFVELEVCDTGIGIALDKIDTIFEPFRQIHSDLTKASDGVGLGLAISRDLAIGMDGELSVKSTQGKGSTFRLRLHRSQTAS